MQAVNLSTFNNWGRTLHFGGGGATPPPSAPPPVAPTRPEAPDNTASQAARKRNGLQKTMLASAPTLGGGGSTLGTSMPTPQSYTGEP